MSPAGASVQFKSRITTGCNALKPQEIAEAVETEIPHHATSIHLWRIVRGGSRFPTRNWKTQSAMQLSSETNTWWSFDCQLNRPGLAPLRYRQLAFDLSELFPALSDTDPTPYFSDRSGLSLWRFKPAGPKRLPLGVPVSGWANEADLERALAMGRVWRWQLHPLSETQCLGPELHRVMTEAALFVERNSMSQDIDLEQDSGGKGDA